MRLFPSIFAAVVCLAATPLSAQEISLQDLARRVEALERENAALKAEVGRLSAPAVQPQITPGFGEPTSHHVSRVPPNWDGVYVGMNAGAARSRYKIEDAEQEGQVSADGSTVGGQLGWRSQVGSIVAGIELEASFPQNQDAAFPVSDPFDSRKTGRVKGQLGLVAGPILFYGTAGLQATEIGILSNNRGKGITSSGFVYGGGIAAKLPWDISVELEALEADLGLIPNVAAVASRTRSIVVRLNHQIK